MWKQYKGIIILGLIVGAGYGGHMLYRYMKIREDSAKRAAEVVRPRLDDDDVAEFGTSTPCGMKSFFAMKIGSIWCGPSRCL